MKKNYTERLSSWRKSGKLQRYLFVFGLLTSTLCFAAYRATYNKLSATEKTSLATPNMSATDILVWANEAAVKMHTYTYLTYRQDLQQTQDYFWPAAWEVYQQALKKQHYKQSLITQQMAVSSVPSDVPLLLKQGVNNGRYTWKVEVPLLLHFQSRERSLNQKILLTLVIQRTPRYLGKRGVGIVRIEEKKNDA